jgi:hypothetical protein
VTSINQGNGTAFRSNLRVRSQSESPTLARSSCLHLAPFPARLRACRSLLLTRGSPKPSSHLLSRAMLLLSILNLASRLRTSSRRVKTRCPAALPELAVERCLPSSVIRRSSDCASLRLPRTFCVIQHNGAIISKRWPKPRFCNESTNTNHHGTRKPRHRKYHRRATRRD